MDCRSDSRLSIQSLGATDHPVRPLPSLVVATGETGRYENSAVAADILPLRVPRRKSQALCRVHYARRGRAETPAALSEGKGRRKGTEKPVAPGRLGTTLGILGNWAENQATLCVL